MARRCSARRWIRLGRSACWSRTALTVVGAALLLLSLRYGIPSIFTAQWLSAFITVGAGTLLGVAFLLVVRRATPGWTLFLSPNLLADPGRPYRLLRSICAIDWASLLVWEKRPDERWMKRKRSRRR